MHCSLCGTIGLKRHKRTGLRICPRHGFVGPRPRVEAYRRGISVAQWQQIHEAKGHLMYELDRLALDYHMTEIAGGKPRALPWEHLAELGPMIEQLRATTGQPYT